MNGDHLHSPNSVRPAIAIDGPAASGKSSAGKMFASQLGYRFLDTGLMYRAATWDVMNNGIDINESEAVSRVVGKMEFSVIDGESGENLILVNGQDVTRFLHSTAVDVSVSPVSAITAVRKIMVAEQRRIATTGSIVMVGVEVTTIISVGPRKTNTTNNFPSLSWVVHIVRCCFLPLNLLVKLS